MLLKYALDLSRNIEEFRKIKDDLTGNREACHSEAVKISRELDEKIVKLQKLCLR
ncbi:Spo0E family sporulation regulatory protein-aspartic acid phosphatase [Ammoniphilus sp. 3BR4]|uniref:Spo0E family sporulation regulatory protein-aspartic acid phosphatase n=1 Tax=Ammoniphilus sp. 3BR4 TaxID=3158265 RepID=UPI003465D942